MKGDTTLTIRRTRIFAFWIVIAAVLTLATPAYAQDITRFVEWTGTLTLEETDDVYTVQPQVRMRADGGFVVSDYAEAQVRLYDRHGALTRFFGEKGSQGPGALQGPTEAVWTSTGQIVVPDLMNGNLSVFDGDGGFIQRHAAVVAPGTHQVRPLSGGKVLLVGSKTTAPGSHSLLHVFDPASGTIERSFFPHPAALGSYGNYLMTVGRIADADVAEGGIVAAFALEPTLYVFESDGSLRTLVAADLPSFRRLKPRSAPLASVNEMIEIAQSHSRIQNVLWLNNDTILIQYYDSIDLHSGEMRWNLAAVQLDGTVLFEATDTPQLFAVDRSSGDLFFSHPDADYENEWIVGRLRSSVTAPLNVAVQR